MLQQTTTENKPQCEKCRGKGFHIEINSLGKIFASCCDNNKTEQNKSYCGVVNIWDIDPDKNETYSKLNFNSLPHNLSIVLKEYLKNWPKIKKENIHARIIANPSANHIARQIEEHQFTAMHLFTRNQVFQIISKNERSNLTEVDQFGNEIDVLSNRTFLGWGEKTHFIISGPTLCTYDQEVYDACVKLWHDNRLRGIFLETNLSQIWNKMGNSSRLNSTKIISLKRSLKRLVNVGIDARSSENKNFWIGGMIDSVVYKEFSRHKDHLVIINFSPHMVSQYVGGAYATLDHDKYKKLTPYAKKLYLFNMSHEDLYRKMGLKLWRDPMGIKESLSDKEFKRQMKDAIKELIDAEILDPKSHIDSKGFLITILNPNVHIESEKKKMLTY